ncbi:MAG: sigma-70 family RNA polymerase sigma factor [Mediterranea sp.]|nr:sigma-70 family RNA polymerase sigma factor [Mediterranea sp.]
MLEKLQQGDQTVYKIIFRQYYPAVLNFLKSAMGNADDAEETAQEVFLKLWLFREWIDARRDVRSYLFAITRHEIVDFYRKNRPLLYDDLPDWMLAPSDDESDEQLIAKELQQLIDERVTKMPERRKACYQYSRVEGLPNEMIARKLHITKNAVEKNITYALKDIRALFEK